MLTNAALHQQTQEVNSIAERFAKYAVSLSNEERKGIRGIGASRMGLALLINQTAMQFNQKLSKQDNAEELDVRLENLKAIRGYKIAVATLLEKLDDTDKALSPDIMKHVDKFRDALNSARRHDGDLDNGMKEIDAYHSRFGASMKEEDETSVTNANTIL